MYKNYFNTLIILINYDLSYGLFLKYIICGIYQYQIRPESFYGAERILCNLFKEGGGVIFLVLSAYRTLVSIPVCILVYGQQTGRGLS